MIEHKIELTGNNPVKSRPCPLPYAMRENLKKEIENMLSLGIIRESNSPFASPIVIVKKDGSDRICVNYRKLNKLTIADPEPMVTADDLFQRLGKASITPRLISARDTGKSQSRKRTLRRLRRYVRFSEDAFWDEEFGGNVGLRNEKDFS